MPPRTMKNSRSEYLLALRHSREAQLQLDAFARGNKGTIKRAPAKSKSKKKASDDGLAKLSRELTERFDLTNG